MHVYGELFGTLTAQQGIIGTLVAPQGIQGMLTIPSAVGVETYEGEYEFTPTQSTQTISIENKMATQDITINPIPSCYGLITWNGATLTVS